MSNKFAWGWVTGVWTAVLAIRILEYVVNNFFKLNVR